MADIVPQITRDSRLVLNNAKRIAKRYKQKVITPDHLLLGLLQLSGCQAEAVLAQLQVDLNHLKARVEAYIKLQARQSQAEMAVGNDNRRIKLSIESTMIMDEAVAEAKENDLGLFDTRLLVLGMLRQPESSTAELLHQYGVTLERFRAQAQLKENPPVDQPRFKWPDLSYTFA